MNTRHEIFGEVITSYSRAQAIEDGQLIDVSETAREAGVKFPTALTSAVWENYVKLSPAAKSAGQDEKGRLWDIVWMFRCAAVVRGGDEITFQLYVSTTRREPSLVTLKAICGPGDDAEPVITIMLPDED